MEQTIGYKAKGKQFFLVLLPIFITQLSLTATGFADTIMAGHISEEDLAGVAIGTNIFMPFMSSFLGIISGLTPVISQLYGANKKDKIRFIAKQGFYWSMLLAAIFLLASVTLVPLAIDYLDLESRVAIIAKGYYSAIMVGIPPIFLAGVLRYFIDAHGYTKVTMIITMLTVPINIVANYMFMYGFAIVPSFGGIGAGIGSAVAFFINLLLNIMAISFLKPFKEYNLLHDLPKPQWAEWKKQLKLGIPIGSTMFCEQSIFSAVGLFMTVYGTTVVAAHQSAMNFTTMVYMIPLSAGMTLTILVGFEVGAKRLNDAKQYIKMGRYLTFFFEGSIALILVQFRDKVAALYSPSAEIQPILMTFLVYAVFLQLADSIDAPLQGALRGYKDVNATFCLAILSYWIIGLPVGYIAANYFGQGANGYWLGLVVGVMVGAVCLTIRLRQVQRRFS